MIDLCDSEEELARYFFEKYNNNNVILERFEEIRQLYFDPVSNYDAIDNDSFGQYLTALPDFRLLLPVTSTDKIRDILATEKSGIIIIAFYLLLPPNPVTKSKKIDTVIQPTIEKLATNNLTIEL